MNNPYNCSTCENEDCTGCGESAYEEGYFKGLKDSEMYKALKEIHKIIFMDLHKKYPSEQRVALIKAFEVINKAEER